MREIEFRAWDDEKLAMVRAILFENESSRIVDERGFDLMQFTGLRDKNGVKIFEGDITSMWYAPKATCRGVAVFDGGSFKFKTEQAAPRECNISEIG